MANALPASSGFTNINKIIQANQTNQLGNAVQTGAQNSANKLGQQVGQAQQQFSNDANNQNLQTNGAQQNTTNAITAATNQSWTPTAATNAASATPTAAQGGGTTTQPEPAATGDNSLVTAFDSSAAPSTTTTAASTSAPAATNSTSTTPAASTTTPSTTADTTSTSPGSFGFSSNSTSGQNQTQANPNGPNFGQQQQVQQYLQGGYTGPTALNNATQLQAQGQQLGALGAASQQPGGQQALLQQYVGRPGYGAGMQQLDTAILGMTDPNQVRAAQQILSGAGTNTNQALQNAQNQGASIAAGNSAFGQGVNQQIQSAQNPIEQTIANNLTALNNQNTAQQTIAQQIYGDLNNAAGSPALTAQQQVSNVQDALNQAAQNGMIDESTLNQISQNIPAIIAQGGNIQDALAQAFNYTPGSALPQYTMQQGASAQQAASLNSLNSLLGQTPDYSTYGGLALPGYGFDASKLAGYTNSADAQAAANGGYSGVPNRGALYDIANVASAPMVAPFSGATAAVGNFAGDTATTGKDLLTGDVGGALNSAIGTPGNTVNAGINSAEAGMNSGVNSLQNLTGNNKTLNGVLQGANGVAQAPLNYLSDSLSGATSGVQNTVNDLKNLNLSGALGDALKGTESAIVNPITNAVNGIGNAIGDVFGGGRWFCTELYIRKLIGMSEMYQMSKFLLRSSISRTNICLFYAHYGDFAALVANHNNFDWTTVKEELTSEVIDLMNSGKFKEAQEKYSLGIKKMFVMFPESAYLWDDRLLKTTILDIAICFFPLICTYTFRQAVKIFFNGLFKKEK